MQAANQSLTTLAGTASLPAEAAGGARPLICRVKHVLY